MRSEKQNTQRGSFLPPDFNGSLEDYISIIYDHQKTCQKQGKYIQADLAKKKLIQLKSQLQSKVKDQIKLRHKGELNEVEKAHLQQFEEFNNYWDTKIQEYEEEALKVDQEIRNRHREELEQFQKEIQKSLGLKPKQTPNIINLRKIQQSLAKVQNYQQAHKVQQKISELQKVEIDKWGVAKTIKIKNLLNQLQAKQNTQLNAVRQKIQGGYQLQKKARQTELSKLMQKYHNFMKELQTQHNQQIIKLQKSIKNQSFLSASISRTTSNMSRALTSKNR